MTIASGDFFWNGNEWRIDYDSCQNNLVNKKDCYTVEKEETRLGEIFDYP